MECSVDLRYHGQGYELNVPWRNAPELLGDFHATHQRRFGYHHTHKKVELVTLRVRASLPQQGGSISRVQTKSAAQTAITHAPAYFGSKSVSTQILRRETLQAGCTASGPLIVTEYTATTVVAPGWKLDVDRSGALMISRRGNAKPGDDLKRKRRSV
jgi:N-methylhydantoinase A